jgi:hypothetical protein
MTDAKEIIFAVLILIGALFALVSNFIIEMPYNIWLYNHLPVWLGIMNSLIFGLCFIAVAIPSRPIILNNVIGIIFLMSALILKPSIQVNPSLNSSLIYVSIFCHIIFRIYFKLRGSKGKVLENN